MHNHELQLWVEQISRDSFQRPFVHKARFNSRLRSTGGRYMLKTHHIEINPHQLSAYGSEEVEKIIKHELCHYHLHLLGRGYRHRDTEFKLLLEKVGGARYCQALPQASNGTVRARRTLPVKYRMTCEACGAVYLRKRKMDTKRYVCGICRGRLIQIEI